MYGSDGAGALTGAVSTWRHRARGDRVRALVQTDRLDVRVWSVHASCWRAADSEHVRGAQGTAFTC